MVQNTQNRCQSRCIPAQTALRDEDLLHAFFLETDYLLSIEEERLLAGFRETAGLEGISAARYGGWEISLIGGHTMGHYLSACARAAACSDVPETERLKLCKKIYRIVDALAECQKCSRGKKGFLFGAVVLDHDNVEAQFDHVEQGLCNIVTEAWVPWYTMHKLLSGLIDVYRYLWYDPALQTAEKLGDWVCGRCLSWDEETRQRVLSVEYGGMNDCLYELYAYTEEERYARAAHVFDEDALFRRVASGGVDVLNDLHANTTIPKFSGALNRYRTLHGRELSGETVDAEQYLRYAEAFWELVVSRHTYITGGNSEWEHFGRDGILDAERTSCNNETCNVYNMLKLSQELYMVCGEKKYLDYYERAFINTILSSQNPKTGMTTYFQPMANGYFKVYGRPYDKFWCCTGSGMENFTRLNDGIYYVAENQITVALYISSVFSDEKMGITLEQRTDMENSDTVYLTVQRENGKTQPVCLRLRLPEWTGKKPALYKKAADGQRKLLSYQEENGFAVVSCGASQSEEYTFILEKKLAAEALPDAPDVAGFLYGPIVLSAELGTEDMRETVTGVDVTIPAEKCRDCDAVILPEGGSAEAVIREPEYFLMREDAEELSFRFRGTSLIFAPHYRKYKSRYGIYWKLLPGEDAAREEMLKAEQIRIVDTVQPGYGQYENDMLHRMCDGGSKGVTNDGTSRCALAGGFFSYRMAVCPDCANELEIGLRRQDNGKWLTVAVGKSVLFDGRLSFQGDATEYSLRFAIPQEETKSAQPVQANRENYHEVEVRFCGTPDEPGARVCGFIRVLCKTPKERRLKNAHL